MNASQYEYRNLIAEVYEKKIKGCPLCSGLNPECICMKKFHNLCAIANAKIPYKFRYAKIEQHTEDLSEAERATIRKYIKYLDKMRKDGYGLWVSGQRKSGKTLLICCVLTAAIKQNYSAYYLDLEEFYKLQEIRYSSEYSERYHSIMGFLHQADFLAIDGVNAGVPGSKNASKQALIHLFQQRVDAQKPTLIVSAATDDKGLSLVSPELPYLIKEGCPVSVNLTDSKFVETESENKSKAFNNLP